MICFSQRVSIAWSPDFASSPWHLVPPLNIPLNLLLSRISMTFLLQDSMNAFLLLEVLFFLGFHKTLLFWIFVYHLSHFLFQRLLLNWIFNCWDLQGLVLGLLRISFALLLSNLTNSKEFQCHLHADDSKFYFLCLDRSLTPFSLISYLTDSYLL